MNELIQTVLNSRITHGVIGAGLLIFLIQSLWRHDNFYEIAWWAVGTIIFVGSAIGVVKMSVGG